MNAHADYDEVFVGHSYAVEARAERKTQLEPSASLEGSNFHKSPSKPSGFGRVQEFISSEDLFIN